jgi:hypothetical protein
MITDVSTVSQILRLERSVLFIFTPTQFVLRSPIGKWGTGNEVAQRFKPSPSRVLENSHLDFEEQSMDMMKSYKLKTTEHSLNLMERGSLLRECS